MKKRKKKYILEAERRMVRIPRPEELNPDPRPRNVTPSSFQPQKLERPLNPRDIITKATGMRPEDAQIALDSLLKDPVWLAQATAEIQTQPRQRIGLTGFAQSNLVELGNKAAEQIIKRYNERAALAKEKAAQAKAAQAKAKADEAERYLNNYADTQFGSNPKELQDLRDQIAKLNIEIDRFKQTNQGSRNSSFERIYKTIKFTDTKLQEEFDEKNKKLRELEEEYSNKSFEDIKFDEQSFNELRKGNPEKIKEFYYKIEKKLSEVDENTKKEIIERIKSGVGISFNVLFALENLGFIKPQVNTEKPDYITQEMVDALKRKLLAKKLLERKNHIKLVDILF